MAEPQSTAAIPPPPPVAVSEETPPARSGRWRFGNASASIVRDSCSCFVVVLGFWFFVSMTMILGVYGSITFELGPKSSIVFQPSPVFVKFVKVENLKANPGPGPIFYGTYGYPPLDVVTTWGETFNVSLPSYSHKEWKYYLNSGSAINISYHVSSSNSSVVLVIVEGVEGLYRWLEDPKEPNTTLSWNVIRGTGMITQEIFWSSSYYVSLGNLDEEVEVALNLSLRSYLYNTTNAYYKCVLSYSPCSLNIFLPDGNAAVLVTPGPQQNSSNEWYFKLSYGPRWVIYIFGLGALTLLVFWTFNLLNTLQCAGEVRYERTEFQRAPLLSHKDDDLSSWSSSYDSLPQDEEDLYFLPGGPIDGKFISNGETSNNTKRLCAICFDAPRDCFFLPCGHCVACFACGTRIAEAAGTCPVCRRNVKKFRKIFNV